VRRGVTAALAIAALAAFAATSANARPDASSLKLSAPSNGSIKFNTKSLKARAGKVTITFSNPSKTPHGVKVGSRTSKIVTKGTTSITLTLKKGKYTFLCPVGDHASEGMKGTIIVS
jgi:plastocyanin